MTFAQFIGTAGLATRLFGEFPQSWKIGLVGAMISLITLGIAMYPNESGKGE